MVCPPWETHLGRSARAGIVATKTVESDAHVIFVGFFCLIGVPLYAFMLGSFANLLTERYMEQQTTTKLNTALTTAESAFLAHLAGADGNSEARAPCASVASCSL